MDVRQFFNSCRIGDFQRVVYLVEEKEVEVNVRDIWDSTPLYYACLCGHKDIVKYLLEKGAKCEANTFDGERCLYGALTDEIRNILRSYCVISKRTIRRELYEEFLRKISEEGQYEDIQFYVHGEQFCAHRCILSARCSYFGELLQTRWKDRRVVELKHQMMVPWAFRCILQYLYTGRLETPIEAVDDVMCLAKQCKLDHLVVKTHDTYKRTISYEMSKPGVTISMLTVEPFNDSYQLQHEMGQLAFRAIPEEMREWVIGELPFEPTAVDDGGQFFSDLIFNIDGQHFHCHKVFFCCRSDYFRALVRDHFHESEESDNIPVITLHDVSPSVFMHIVYYIYQDSTEMSGEIVFDILCAADLYLLPGLKRQCAGIMGRYLDHSNIFNILQTARLFTLPRLEAQCFQYIASNLPELICREEFANLVRQDATTVRERQETDTIDIVDEIRFYITNLNMGFSEMTEANEKLRLIDDLLEELDLEG